MAAKHDFGGVTRSVVKDIVNMSNKEVQQELCSEPKYTVDEIFQFAIFYEEGAIGQQSYDKVDKPN